MSKPEALFPRDYQRSRDQFLKEVERHRARITSHELRATGPSGEPLFIDIAEIGNPSANRHLIHIAGTHGVEGFAGAAVQRRILESSLTSPNVSTVFVHCLNPWGMAHLRRVNESNVDLNRNFLEQAHEWSGVPDAYRQLDHFINPRRAPSRIEPFYLEVAWFIARYGFRTLKQAIAGGQYEFPKGIYFGGRGREESIDVLAAFARERLSAAEQVVAIEVHTGLGPYAGETTFGRSADLPPSLRDALQRTITGEGTSDAVGYMTSGEVRSGITRILGPSRCHWFLQEFGTFHPVRVFQALRAENQHHHFGTGRVDHWSKRNLLEMFCPANPVWREKILSQGVDLYRRGLAWLSDISAR